MKRKLLFVATVAGVLWMMAYPDRPEMPPQLRSRLESIGRPNDQPGAAAAYHLSRRLGPDGEAVDLYEKYQVARRHLDRMPRYSSVGNTSLPPRADKGALADSNISRGAANLQWTPLGPGNIGGRTRSLLIHPDDSRRMVAGGVSGGVWKSDDSGVRWRPVADLLPNIAVSTMAMDPAAPQHLFAGTGEGHFREVVRGTGLPLQGGGIFESNDFGETWQRLDSTATSDFQYVNDLEVSAQDPERLYAATRTGVWRSLNGGSSWSRVLNPQRLGGCFDLEQRKDQQEDYLLASCGTFAQAAIYRNRSAEGAGTWEIVLSEFGMGLTSLAIAPSRQDTVYAISASYTGGPQNRFNGGLHAVFRSDQGGAAGSWNAQVRNSDPIKLNTLLLTNPAIASLVECELDDNNVYSNLGWYTNLIAVDPQNPETVWAGGVDLFRSDDGGKNWGPVSHWFAAPPSAHADQHVIRFHPGYDGADNQTLFLAGDGGVFRTDNALAQRATDPRAPCDPANSQVNWTPLNANFGITQFYHGAPLPDGSGYLGGTQDNGTVRGSDVTGIDGWQRILGGDGGYVAVDPNEPDIIYAESQGLALAKSIDGGETFSPATNGITEPPSNYLFIVPFVMDPSESRRLWIGGRILWRTEDGAESWRASSRALSGTDKISAIAVAPSDPNRVAAATNGGSIHRQTGALQANGLTTWPSFRPRSGFVTWLTYDPADADILYATYGGFGGSHVWKSADGGASWASIDGNGSTSVPDIPVHAILVHPERRERLFLATDLGVLVSIDGGLNWAVENSGFANVVTESLSIAAHSPGGPTLFAFTHGRGVWRTPLAGVEPASCQPDRWLPHVPSPLSGFETAVFSTSFSGVVDEVELVPFTQDGRQLTPVNLELQPDQTRRDLTTDLFADDVSHIGICGPPSIAVSVAYRFVRSFGVSAHVPEVTQLDSAYLIYPGEWETVFDGIALINRGEGTARVEAVLSDPDGAEVHRVVLHESLPRNAKIVAVLDFLFREFEGRSIEITSSQPALFLSLRGTRPPDEPMLLYQTVPIPVTPRQN